MEDKPSLLLGGRVIFIIGGVKMSVNGQTVINTISHAITCFNNIKDAIEYMGVTVGSSTADDYPDLIKSIQGDSAELIDDLNDIYLAITARGGTCTEGEYDTYAAGVMSITCDDTVLLLQNYLEDVYNAILIRGGQCTHLDYSTYDTGVLSINTSSSMAYLQSCLADIYDAIVEQGSTATENDYSTYAQGVLNIETSSSEVAELEAQVAALQAQVTSLQSQINTKDATISSLQSQVSTLTSQVSSLQGTITSYESSFADIATAITNMGGTVVDSSAYSDFDSYVLSIPNTVVQGGDLDRIKSQIYSIGAIEQNARSINSSFGVVPLIRVTDGSNLFADMPNFEAVDMYLDMSACTDCTDMFKNSTKVPVITILNFGNNSNADLVLDLAVRDDFDLSYMAGDIKKYTTSPDGTKHVRKFLVTQGAYNLNNDWGAIETLRNKGITVEVKQSS